MISVISSAKSMCFDNCFTSSSNALSWRFQEKTNQLLEYIQTLSIVEIEHFMGVSKKIANENYYRFQNFINLPNKAAIFAYNGEVYKQIISDGLSEENLSFAQNHLLIISAFYGLLTPLDLIKSYRLEMKFKIPNLVEQGLALWWQKSITSYINLLLTYHKTQYLINIASNEYIAAISNTLLRYPIINIHFRQMHDNKLKNIALRSKKARGLLVKYIIKNNIDSISDIIMFNSEGYLFNKDISDNKNLVFILQ